MLDSDSSATCSSIDYDEVYSLFTKDDLEDVLIKTAKQPMTVKEECEAIEKLKSENFDLKWRLYLLNQDYKELLLNAGGSKQSSENGSVKNFARKESIKDKEIKMLKLVLEQRVKQLTSLKCYYDEIVKSKDVELEDLKMEKSSAYVTELECNAAALYEIIESKDGEIIELKDRLENQKNQIRKLSDDLKSSLANRSISNQSANQPVGQTTINQTTVDTVRLSLEQTRKELDQVKFELKNQKIMEKEKLDNYARLVTQNEVEIELLKEQIISLKERENYLQKETDQLQNDNERLQENEDQLVNELKRVKLNEDQLLKENQEYELRTKEHHLVKKRLHLLKENNQQTELDTSTRKVDENSNLIKNSIDVQELFRYTKRLEERLDYQDDLLHKNELEKEQLIITLNMVREKKKNLENTISKQLAKTNNLLATAKQNFTNKS